VIFAAIYCGAPLVTLLGSEDLGMLDDAELSELAGVRGVIECIHLSVDLSVTIRPAGQAYL
jgi:hypothetical protein